MGRIRGGNDNSSSSIREKREAVLYFCFLLYLLLSISISIGHDIRDLGRASGVGEAWEAFERCGKLVMDGSGR